MDKESIIVTASLVVVALMILNNLVDKILDTVISVAIIKYQGVKDDFELKSKYNHYIKKSDHEDIKTLVDLNGKISPITHEVNK